MKLTLNECLVLHFYALAGRIGRVLQAVIASIYSVKGGEKPMHAYYEDSLLHHEFLNLFFHISCNK